MTDGHHIHHHDVDRWLGEGGRTERPGPRRRGRGRPGGPGGRHGGPGRRGFRGGRARRGDVRAAILALLAERPMHGYEIIGELDDRTGGAWRPSPGSVYPTLQMLEEEDLVAAEQVDGKRRFALTAAGREQAEAQDGPTPWEAIVEDSEPSALRLREELASAMQAVKQVVRTGSPAQQARGAEVLAETRRKLYEVLASDA